MTKIKKSDKLILWFSRTNKNDIPLVGGKAANLGEMIKAGAPVPDGFTVTVNAYFELLKRGGLKKKIESTLADLNTEDSPALEQASQAIKTHILASSVPSKIETAIKKAYRKLSGTRDIPVAVRSSATAEDLPEASFAGQQETYLYIKGEAALLEAVKKCWASLFTARAIFYRETHGFDHLQVGLAVPIQKMIIPEVSGVMFTVEPLTNDQNKIAIEAVYGTGEGLVQGMFIPDRYTVDKENLKVLEKEIATQPFQITDRGEIPVSKAYQKAQKLSDKFIRETARWGKKIEEHYQFPQDLEWVFSGRKVWIVQTRPVTTLPRYPESVRPGRIGPKDPSKGDSSASPQNDRPLLSGIGASPGTASGPVKILSSPKELSKIKKGDVLAAKMTNPDYVPAMKRAAAIVTDQGGRTSHAAIVSRELGIPCIVGTINATTMLKEGEVVTVVGEEGKIFSGQQRSLPEEKGSALGLQGSNSPGPGPEKKRTWSFSFEPLEPSPEESGKLGPIKTATKVYVNLGEPELAEEIAARNVDGVGLLRSEFVFAQIGTHPRALIKKRKEEKLIEALYEGIFRMTKTFAPRPVVYRTNDFKTSEYRNLAGGKEFEEEEANPMLGFRGAARYIVNPEVFQIELEAIKRVRRYHKNLWVMIPFVRTPEELVAVKKIMSAAGLHRGGSFKLWLMVEIPSNVILLEKFIGAGIDGISIGSNDLTQLTLGVDRDNAKLADLFDERNDAVLFLIQKAIKEASAHGITSSICGQAPSVYPELTKKLVEWGITSVSVSPDMIEKTRQLVYEAEKELVK